ncbi:MAG: L-seryl-tRNA(Sec) selenium transferase, partial [Eggerthellaceae bacterium]|nr:L-seryl-tRNA(Sec) selenium transferase [Eggerthellaceae bacterium]
RSSIRQGCDLVSFSGDKLLGGPQAGIVVGKSEYIRRLKKNPLVRAFRVDKMTLAALESTLRLLMDPQKAMQEIPTLKMLGEPASKIRNKAAKLKNMLAEGIPEEAADVRIERIKSKAGGGTMPLLELESYGVAICFNAGSAHECDKYLTGKRDVPVIARISREELILDCRTIQSDELAEAANAVCSYFSDMLP